MIRTKHISSALLLLAPIFAAADISYRVAPDPTQSFLNVRITVPTQGGTEISLQMPNWAPGSYRLNDAFQNVKELKGSNESGKYITPVQPNPYTWTFSTSGAKTLSVEYRLPMTLVDGALQYSGPSTYLYVVGRKEETCNLKVDLPENWAIATGLDEDGGKTQFKAPNYDVLADNPVSMGSLMIDTYTVRGKPHYIVMRGVAKADVNRQYLTKACKYVSEAESDFFGGVPYSKYVWHFTVSDAADGGGGLEHLNSTQIGLSSGVGPRMVGVLSHEFFHLWNVKRTRSKPLGPFDYTQLPKTGALWWLEGVTDYYAHLFLLRYGWSGEDEWNKSVIQNLMAVRGNPARLEVSPYDSSYRVGEASNGRGNSNGYRISYYNLGFLAGVCLDVELRSRTNGRHSLDDVAKALYQLCKDGKPGFEENEIRNQLVRFGGSGMGDFYDRIIMKPGEMPVEDAYSAMGLKLAQGMETFADTGITWAASKADGGARIRSAQGPATDILRTDDIIVAINGKSTQLASNKDITLAMQGELDNATVGQPISMKIRRGEETLDLKIAPAAGSRNVWQVGSLGQDLTKTKLRLGWFYAGKRKL